jgi:signal transduction histidine kinase
MTPRSSRGGAGIEGRPQEREWLPLAAFVFVIFALVAMSVIPAVLLRRMARTADEVATTLLPMNEGLRDFTLAMENRITSSRALFLTRDTRYAVGLARARTSEAAALSALDTLAPRLGPSAEAHLASLQHFVARRDSLEMQLVGRGSRLEDFRAALPLLEALRESMLSQVNGLRTDLILATRARVAAEARMVALQRTTSVVLGPVALMAVLIVGWFTSRQRRLRQQLQSALADANRLRELAELHRDEIQRLTERRVRLIRGVTHDVKNPLGAAKGYAELLKLGIKAPVLPEQRPYLEGIQRTVDGALTIISDLLDLARADSGGLPVNRVDVELWTLVRQVSMDHRSAAEAAGLFLEVRLPDRPCLVCTDPARVGQILGNLISNAIKYTPVPGRITVSSGNARSDAAERAAWAAVAVSDTGPGIPRDQREAIFDEFTRLDDGGAQKGHGLGLAIARRIARLLGGDLTVEDSQDGGAMFVLRLPLRAQASREGLHPADAGARS